MAWKNSTSTSGGDFIIYYLSRVKQKRIYHISLIFAIIFGAFALVLNNNHCEALVINADKPFNFGFVFG
ncbi:hypothetical protein HYD98_01970 [Mycoplasmopsis bovis]|nr:hypothetical protein [Mycoplasmopsis bovis]QQH29096.1 hypothetical protein HYD98_01970 [Mycoplasmopsis bovis]